VNLDVQLIYRAVAIRLVSAGINFDPGRTFGSKGTLGYSKTIPEPLPCPRYPFICPADLFLLPDASTAKSERSARCSETTQTVPTPPPLSGRFLFLLLLFEAAIRCTASTGTTPGSLLSSCISCNLLLPIKGYGEVHVEIRGSSHDCTGKCSDSYGEVHTRRTGKFTPNLRFPQRILQKRTAKFIPNHPLVLFHGVRGSSH
jgi:hypothetical protein